MPSRKQTIKKFVQALFVKVNFVDIYGRNVGFDYTYILECIRTEYPDARTSRPWLRKMAYELVGHVRMPVRRRTRRGLAEDYAMTILVLVAAVPYGAVQSRVRRKFPDHVPTRSTLIGLERRLRNLNFKVPPRQ